MKKIKGLLFSILALSLASFTACELNFDFNFNPFSSSVEESSSSASESGDLSESADSVVIEGSAFSIHFLELGNAYTGDCTLIKVGDTEVLIALAASSLVVPDLKDQKLLEALSEKAKTTVLSPSQAAKAMLTMAELFKLMKVYHSFCKMGESVDELIAKAKN